MEWYGWETLIGGGGTILLPLALLHSQPQTALVIGAIISPLATMGFHMLHGDDVKGYVSAPVSYAMMAGGGALAAGLVCGAHSRQGCVNRWAFNGLILGAASAVVLDAVALAWGGPPLSASGKPLSTPVKKAVLLPFVVPLQGGAAVGLGGAF